MARTKKSKKSKGLVVFIVLLAALALLVYSVLYTGGVVLKKTDSTEVINKIKVIQIKGGEFELNQEDVDQLSNLYFESPKNKGDITLKGANIEVLKDKLLIEAPISYKNINLLFSSAGKISISNGDIVYDADNFKIGKLTLPKSMVISQISKNANESFYVEDNLIKIKESAVHFKMKDLKIVDSKIVGTAEKMDIKALFDALTKNSVENIDKQLTIFEQKIQGASSLMNESQKQKMNEIKNTIDAVKYKSIDEKKKVISDIIRKLDKAISETGDSEIKKELEKIKAET
ncbi:hypothetical protein K9O30_09930 [Clostridium bowmanii]|uniref:DUF2140 family protein n=1 Tax=Clostridium bowmanii TaxID=132925 RepID=UPI001C0BB77A|nr:DUF2140 family protein [Clostridium bowmanii]MBU3189418.1 DUF2140 family protein [Clostridium bowmanii]MCA1074032.1 hypothetical protein [Clostridium bowmanii]